MGIYKIFCYWCISVFYFLYFSYDVTETVCWIESSLVKKSVNYVHLQTIIYFFVIYDYVYR